MKRSSSSSCELVGLQEVEELLFVDFFAVLLVSLQEASFQAVSHREVSCYGISARKERSFESDGDHSVALETY